jgi:hypothetical protein
LIFVLRVNSEFQSYYSGDDLCDFTAFDWTIGSGMLLRRLWSIIAPTKDKPNKQPSDLPHITTTATPTPSILLWITGV